MTLLLIAMTTGIYAAVCHFGLVDYDDPTYLDNPYVQSGLTVASLRDAFTHMHFANYAPLVSISYCLDQTLFHLRPGPMHVENVLLHLVTGLLLWRLLFESTGKLNQSFAVAAIFLCHPMHVESVAWISERKDVLSTPLLLAAMLFYVRYCRALDAKKWWMYALCILFFVLSLMTKSMGVTLPAVLLLMDYWPLKRWPEKNHYRLLIEKIPLLAITLVFSKIASASQTNSGATTSFQALSLSDRVANAIVSYVLYIVKLAVPTNLAVFYQHPGWRPLAAVAASLGLLILISYFAWQLRWQKPYVIVGWFWFLGTLVPVIGIVQIGSQAMADRYSYLPSIGLFVAIVWAFAGVVRNSAVRSGFLIVTVIVFSVMARIQVSYWRDTETLFTHALAVTDQNALAHVILAREAYLRNQPVRAIEECNAALRDQPGNAYAYDGLGNCWLVEDKQRAIENYKEAVLLSPRTIVFYIHLAEAQRRADDISAALQSANDALRLDSSNSDAQTVMRLIVQQQAKPPGTR